MTRSYHPVAADRLGDVLVDAIVAAPVPGTALRVALDGPPCAEPGALAAALVPPLRALGRNAVLIPADTFWRDASVRLEHGREDVDSYLSWLDAEALRREVLDPLGRLGSGTYLPSLRDPVTNRSTRAAVVAAAPATVLLVHGSLLLGRDLPFDLTVHLVMSPAARARRTVAAQAWTLPAFDRYDQQARPADCADVVVRMDDPRHPAVGLNGSTHELP